MTACRRTPRGPWAAAIIVALTVACTSGPRPMDARPYDEAVQAWRAEKDMMFRSPDDSPLLAEDRATFTGLPYFGIDARYRTPARLSPEPSAKPVIIEVENSKREREPLRRVGRLHFTLNGAEQTLTAFAPVEARVITRLFVPFGDLTNGAETYKGGRYLDLDRTPTGLYDLDFNRAYHPNCVFNIDWVCPVPPPENRLPVAIRAGEMLRK